MDLVVVLYRTGMVVVRLEDERVNKNLMVRHEITLISVTL
jgi:hypothetical protein